MSEIPLPNVTSLRSLGCHSGDQNPTREQAVQGWTRGQPRLLLHIKTLKSLSSKCPYIKLAPIVSKSPTLEDSSVPKQGQLLCGPGHCPKWRAWLWGTYWPEGAERRGSFLPRPAGRQRTT